ncbi:Vacuolar protein sorting-associated protein 18-like protein [Hypsibius exemplaris]|uniref:Vacuolar protein sorting-associated protein 18 homolog n=1 Tax=Hypsibius exemplaris TaxID=2072580 RepID=A0A1W0X0X1_HYPEX|nr:Vacuolar protein sorting-associated protein 18-like protein [Hypsibius exemplaris]
MASLLEQYEQATASSVSSGRPDSLVRGKTGGGTRAKTTDQAAPSQQSPIFSKTRVDFQIPNGKTVYRMAVSDRLIVMAMKDNTLLRIDLRNSPDQTEMLEIKSGSAGDGVEEIFLDPLGKTMLLAMRSGECLFYGRSSKKSKSVTRLKTHILSAVGWNYDSTAAHGSPTPILLGTAQGVVFETELNPNAADSSGVFMASSVDVYWKQVCSLAQPEPVLIKGIFIDRLRKTGDRNTYVVLIATPTRLYHFKGALSTSSDPPLFVDIFQLDPEKPMTNFLELPGNPRHCCLATWRPPLSDVDGVSSAFAWLTEPGVYYADVGGGGSDDTILLNPQLYAFPKDKANRPVSLVSTEFHVLIQYPTFVRVLSKLASQIIMEDMVTDRYGKLMGICRDTSTGAVWLYSETAVYRYKITDESRDVWRIYLDKGDFDSALRFTQGNAATTNLIRLLKAENCIQKSQFEQAAEIYAASDAPFEEVALKFSRLGQENALKILLMKKAEALRATQSLPQLFMIASWLMEIFLNSLGHLKNTTDSTAYKSVLLEFRTFLTSPVFLETFQSASDVFFSLLLSHSAHDDYVFFAAYLNDVKRLLDFHLERNNFRDVLRLLAVQGNADLIYEFSPRLMRHVPGQLVDVWISKSKSLNPHRLLPSLQKYDGPELESEANQVVRYLEHCIHVLAFTDTALHNYLVTLYCKLRNEDALQAYLLNADEESSRRSIELYDQKSALRLCVESGLNRAAVHLYCALGLHSEAVELALQFDLTLAKQIAAASELEESLSRKLWLTIAQHVIHDDRDISKATEILHESGSVIKIEDILPFFPDFVTIDDFKEAICASLEDYNRHIGTLKGEVDDATAEAQDLRSEIQDYRSQCLYINTTDVCTVCKQPLLTSQIYVFPCKHHLHEDCLLNTLRPHLASSKRLHIEDLKKQVELLKNHDDVNSVQSFGSATQSLSRRDAVKQELEETIASECPFCGLLMIKSIDLPFLLPEDYENSIATSWL